MNLWELIKCKTETKFVFAGSGCGTRCTAAMSFMIRPCLKPLPGQTSVLWVMMVLKLLCSLPYYFLSPKSATIDLFLLWCRSLGCRYYFFHKFAWGPEGFFSVIEQMITWRDGMMSILEIYWMGQYRNSVKIIFSFSEQKEGGMTIAQITIVSSVGV